MSTLSGWYWVGLCVLGFGFSGACGGETSDGEGGAAGTGAGGGSRAIGGSDEAGAPATGGAESATECVEATDCGWGEIDHEILSAKDCPCLLGCPGHSLNRETIERRQEQYDALCDWQYDGNGERCPIDDCITPPTPTCVNQTCGPTDLW